MRNGGTARFSVNFSNLLPVVANADPPAVSFEMRDPAGAKTVWVFGTDPEIVQDAVGSFFLVSPPLDLAAGGTYTFVAKGPGYPEARCEIVVEPSAW